MPLCAEGFRIGRPVGGRCARPPLQAAVKALQGGSGDANSYDTAAATISAEVGAPSVAETRGVPNGIQRKHIGVEYLDFVIAFEGKVA